MARAGAESGDVDGAAFFFGVGVGATIDGKAEAPLLSSAIVAAFVGVARGVGLVAAGFVAAGFAWSEGKADCECATGAHKIAAAQVAALAEKLKPKRVRRDRVLVVTGGVFIRKLALRGLVNAEACQCTSGAAFRSSNFANGIAVTLSTGSRTQHRVLETWLDTPRLI